MTVADLCEVGNAGAILLDLFSLSSRVRLDAPSRWEEKGSMPSRVTLAMTGRD